MGKPKKKKREGRRQLGRKTSVQPPPKSAAPSPRSPRLTLPPSMTVQEIMRLQARLEQRRVLRDFQGCDPGTIYLKRQNDPEDMSVQLGPGKFDMKLRALIGSLLSETERELDELGINLDELDLDLHKARVEVGDGEDDEGDEQDRDDDGWYDEGEQDDPTDDGNGDGVAPEDEENDEALEELERQREALEGRIVEKKGAAKEES